MMIENKIKMKRHESFSIREGWFAKGIKCINENSKVFSSSDATDILGVGTNMVKSLKYWMYAAGLIEEKTKQIQLTEFGRLIQLNDPYFEDEFTWWLIHSYLVTNISDAYVYNYFFNKINKNFSKKDFAEQVAEELNSNNVEFNENTLIDEVNMVVKTYVVDEKMDNPENNFVCPLSELNLLKKNSKDNYEKTKPFIKKLNYLIVFNLILNIIKEKESLSIEDLIKCENSPAKIFNLDKTLLNEYLDEMKRNELIIINRTAGLNMIYIRRRLSLEDIFNEYFNS